MVLTLIQTFINYYYFTGFEHLNIFFRIAFF